jgi:hypothetical protein
MLVKIFPENVDAAVMADVPFRPLKRNAVMN